MYCDDVRRCCAHEMLKFFHGASYAVCVDLKNFNLCVLFVCFVCGDVRSWGGDIWKFVWWGESGRVGCIRSIV